jgi:predicted  nucleic acid-binding Zn-ribbon protein
MSDSNNKASLGCGSLILIAVIVLIFGNAGNDKELLREVRSLKAEINSLKLTSSSESSRELKLEIAELKSAIAAQSANLAEIQARLEKPVQLPRQRTLPPPSQIEPE